MSGFKTYVIANIYSFNEKSHKKGGGEAQQYDIGYLTKEYAHKLYLLPNTLPVKSILVTSI